MEDVRKEVNALGLRSASGREIPRQSFHNMMRNELYAGWVVSGDVRVKGLHESSVTQQVFDAVQEVVTGKPERKPYKKVRDDFPLRQFVSCAKCGRGLTAGYNRGRTNRLRFLFLLHAVLPSREHPSRRPAPSLQEPAGTSPANAGSTLKWLPRDGSGPLGRDV
jgi:hypothetical protein